MVSPIPEQATKVGKLFNLNINSQTVFSDAYALEINVNITDPSSLPWLINSFSYPSLIGQYDSPGNAAAVFLVNDLIYMTDGLAGFKILNVADPKNPSFHKPHHK